MMNDICKQWEANFNRVCEILRNIPKAQCIAFTFDRTYVATTKPEEVAQLAIKCARGY